jgi:diadenosine tetraphosphate (Ap4A) HIT family hydrolase
MPTPPPQPADCIFCGIVRGDAPATFLRQDELVVAFMDTRPVQPGHLTPRRAHDGLGFRFPAGYGIEPGRAELEAIATQIRPGLVSLNTPEASGR